MKLEEAKNQFVAAWGSFGSNWGVNRTMAQIHALLLVSSEPLCAETVMEALNISRGNANMNLRELINWGLVDRVIITGERREFFSAEKDIYKVAMIIIKERKKRELEPMLKLLDGLTVDGDTKDKDVNTFIDTISGIQKFGEQADKSLTRLIKAEENWFWGTMVKILG